MNPNEYTAAQAADPSTPPPQLADIATHRPDLRAAVASNPAAYPELLQWLGSFGDAEVGRALAARGQAGPPHGSMPAAPTQGDPAAGAQGYGAVGAGYGTTPPTSGYGAQPAYGSQTPYGSQQPAYGTQGHSGAVPSWAPQEKRSRKKLWIGLGAAGVVLVGGGAFAANALWFSKTGGAESPEAAVTQLVEGVAEKDLVAVYGVTSPSEIGQMQTGFDLFARHMADQGVDVEGKETFESYLDAFELELTGLELEVEEIEDGLAKVSVVDGSLEIDADADLLADATVESLAKAEESPLWELFDLAGTPVPSEAEIREEMLAGVEETFPVTVTADDLVLEPADLSSALDLDDYGIDAPSDDPILPFLMAVEEDGDWYVSPYATLMEYALVAEGGERGTMPSDDLAGAFDSPEAAAEGFVLGMKDYLQTGEIDEYIKAFPLADRRLVTLYSNPALESADMAEMQAAMEDLDLSASFSVRSEEDGIAWLTLDSMVLEGDIEGVSGRVELSSECFSGDMDGEVVEGCIDEIPALEELGVGDLALIAVEEDGAWYISGVGTAGDSTGLLGANVLRLYEEGKLLDEQWWMDNLGILADYM
ncbi:variant leucine-rich repeat-containing protein [Sanguibacter suaedae]|uniref:Leucine rich repeat variant domain-containing protein n=1 Tax=Sanguibacter suaedae TaxID=2795737 RepID=A0A934MAL2_9MICO|nr:hypothetical protein [Sanguibacter suaedae]MBI9114356.1 hypothetical protein [Sanguibacter suaedae]